MAESPFLCGRPVFSAATRVVLLLLIVSLGVIAAWTWSHPLPSRSMVADKRNIVQFARKDLESIAATPHPIGSPRQRLVRDFILSRLQTFGLHPEIQETSYVMQNGAGVYKAARIRNIIARVPGSGSTGAVLLVAHYDSADYSPGAADDGAGATSILEAMRTVATGPRLRNDIIALFSDGEEIGLFGARAFMADHPWAKQIRFVINFEARGDKGPSVLFETGAQPGWAIRKFAAGSAYHVADSTAPFIYSLLPNDTDFTIFRQAGIPGLNFAFFDGWPYYHSAADSLPNLSYESLTQQVLIASSLAESMGNVDLRSPPAGDAVYFSIFGRWMLIYSYQAALAFAIAAAAVYVGLVVLGFRNGGLTIGRLFLGVLALPVSVIAACLSSYLVSISFWSLGEAASYASGYYAVSVACLAALLAWSVYLAFSAKIAVENLALGAITWWVGLALFTTLRTPAISYLLTWPLAGALVAVIAIYLSNAPRRAPLSLLLLFAGSIPVVVIFTGTIRTLYAGLPTREFLIAGLIAFGLGLLIPQAWASASRFLWPVTVLLAGASIVTFWTAQRHAVFTQSQPQHDSVQYVLDADRNVAAWMIDSRRQDTWTKQFIDGHPANGVHLPSWFGESHSDLVSSTAPVNAFAAPSVTLISSSNQDGKRLLRLRVISPRQAAETAVHLETKGKILDAALDGRNLADAPLWNGRIAIAHADSKAGPRSDLTLFFYAIPVNGITLEVTADDPGPVRVDVVDRSYQLPNLMQVRFIPRNSSLASDGDASLAIRSYNL